VIWNLFGPILRLGGACNLLFPVYMGQTFAVPILALIAALQGPLFPSVVSEKAKYLFIEITSCLHMIYAIARLNILAPGS
jgi:hypothetical protein